jgi:hypothetical protein
MIQSEVILAGDSGLSKEEMMRTPFFTSLAWFAAITCVAFADSPASSRSDLNRLPREAADLYRDTTLFPRQAKWRRIPWMLDLNEGMRLAKEEKRPLLLWTSGDDPLERC